MRSWRLNANDPFEDTETQLANVRHGGNISLNANDPFEDTETFPFYTLQRRQAAVSMPTIRSRILKHLRVQCTRGHDISRLNANDPFEDTETDTFSIVPR